MSPDVDALAEVIGDVGVYVAGSYGEDYINPGDAALAVLDALPDLMRADTTAGEALRARLGLRGG